MYESAVIVLLGGLFGWVLGKLPDKYVYIVAGITIIAALILFGRK